MELNQALLTHSQRIKQIFYILYQRFNQDELNYRAAALTYMSLLSIVPLMTVSFAVFSAFPVFDELKQQVQDFILSNFVAAAGEVVQNYMQYFVKQTTNLSLIGALFLFVTAILMMYTLEQSFNSIWRVKVNRKGLNAILLYWAILTLSPLILGSGLLLTAYFMKILSSVQTPGIATLAHFFMIVVPFILETIAFTLFYVAIPNCRVPILYGLVGGLAAAFLFEIAKKGFTLYVTTFPTYTLIYGALAAIPLFLLWLYFAWVVILLGAVISNILTTGYHYRSPIKLDAFTHAYRWMGHFWQAFQAGKTLSLQDLIDQDTLNYQIEPQYQLELLQKAHLIRPAESGQYILTQDLSKYTFWDFYLAMPWRLPKQQELQHLSGVWEKNLLEVVAALSVQAQKNTAVPLQEFFC